MERHVPSNKRAIGARIIVMLLTAAGLTLGAPTAAQAGDNGAWSVTPTPPAAESPAPREYFVLEGTPGSVIKDQVRITNFTDKPITFRLYGADAYNTAEGGFFALKTHDEAQARRGRLGDPARAGPHRCAADPGGRPGPDPGPGERHPR